MKQKLNTIRGLRFLAITFSVLILFELISITFFLLAYYGTNIALPYDIFYILMFLAIITFFIGAFLLWKGRTEIEEKHVHSVEKGLWIIIIFLAVTSLSGLFLDATNNFRLSYFILNLMLFLASFYFLKSLVSNKIRNIIWIAIFIFVILDPLRTLLFSIYTTDYLNSSLLRIISTLVPYILLNYSFYTTYKNVKK